MIIFLSDQNMQIRRFFKLLVSIWTVCRVLEVDFDITVTSVKNTILRACQGVLTRCCASYRNPIIIG